MNTNITILNGSRHTGGIPKLISLLESFNLKIDMNSNIQGSSIGYYGNHVDEFSQLLRKIDAVVLFCAEEQFYVDVFRENIGKIVDATKDRDKQIFLVTDDIYKHMLRFEPRTEIEKLAYKYFHDVEIIEIQGDWIDHSMDRVAGRIYDKLNSSNEKNILYDKLLDFQRLGYDLGVLQIISRLIINLSKELLSYPLDHTSRKELYKEIYRLIVMMYQNSTGEFSAEGRDVAHNQLDSIAEAEKLLSENEFQDGDIYYSALAVSMIYLISFIRHDCVEWLTNDDVHLLLQKEHRLARQKFQEPFYEIITNARISENYQALLNEKYTCDEIEVINQVDDNLILNLVSDGHNVGRIVNGVFTMPVSVPKIDIVKELSTEDRLLESIAELIGSSLELFDKISIKDNALELLRLLKTSYERLKNYCVIVGSTRVAAECISYLAEISNRIEQYENEDVDDGKPENGLRSLLGLKLPELGEYDVFLSYKHEDKDIATKCFRFMKEHHIYPFLDYEALPLLSNSDYEDAIMEALDHSKHFIVILTELDYLKSYWVQLEMKTFEHEIAEGRKVGANMILLVSDAVYNAIIETNKKCLPIRFRSFEIMKINNYRNVILPYIEK